MAILLYITVLLIAACGLIYEIMAGRLATCLLGDSVLQFSTIIGSYLFAMEMGSALSRYIHRGLAYRFGWIELMRGVIVFAPIISEMTLVSRRPGGTSSRK